VMTRESIKEKKMKYEKPTVTTYSEEEVLAIIGPAQTGGTSGLDGMEDYEEPKRYY